MAIAGNHLRAGDVGGEPQDLAGDCFDLGIGVGVSAHGTITGDTSRSSRSSRMRLRSVSASQPATLNR